MKFSVICCLLAFYILLSVCGVGPGCSIRTICKYVACGSHQLPVF